MKIRKVCWFKSQQQGAILIIALVLMVIIALGTVASMRLSGSDELVNNNTRSRISALQAANAAIITCRDGVFTTAANWNIRPSGGVNDEGTLWKDEGNWVTSNTTTVTNGSATAQCMVEEITDFMKASSDQEQIVAYRITARGFSPNYQVNADGVQVRGSQAWQQVIVGRTTK